MVDEQMAINRLMCGNTAHSCKADYIQLAIKALEKQVPKKAINKNGIWCCPRCDKHYGRDNWKSKYCGLCGQLLDWSDRK